MCTNLRAYDTWTKPVSTKDASRPTHRELGYCPCCDETRRSLWFKNSDLTLYRCSHCRVVYQDPQPDLSALLDRSYNEDYFSSCHLQLPTQSAALEPRLALLEGLLGSTTYQTPIKLLDVGSGLGAFLLAAKKRGWEPIGLEPSLYAVQYAREKLGFSVIEGTLDDPVSFPHLFDCINLNHVLEHLQQPQQNLARIKTLLRPGGLLVIEVPREGKLASRFLHLLSSWRGATQHARPTFTIVHMCIFSPESLRTLLEQAGFAIERLWIEGNASSPERFAERFGDSPPLGKLLGRASQFLRADVRAGLGNIVAIARRP